MSVQSCVGALVIGEGKVLLGQRSQGRTLCPNVWDLFGGHIEMGEQAEETLIRELHEEIGIKPTLWAYLETVRATFGDILLDCHIFVVTSWLGTPTNRQPEEHAAIEWFTLESALRLDLAHPAYATLLTRCLNEASSSNTDAAQ